jgi:hypothetical protein
MAIPPPTDPSKAEYIKPLPQGRFAQSSGFGYRSDPFLHTTSFHSGLDLRADPGTPIFAPADGKIERMGWAGGYGKYTKLIADKGRYDFAFGHQSKFAKGLKAGAHVKKGQIIGYVGSTGHSTGAHLHYELFDKSSSTQINPAALLARSLSVTVQMAKALADGTIKLAKETGAAADRIGAKADEAGRDFLHAAAVAAGEIPPATPSVPLPRPHPAPGAITVQTKPPAQPATTPVAAQKPRPVLHIKIPGSPVAAAPLLSKGTNKLAINAGINDIGKKYPAVQTAGKPLDAEKIVNLRRHHHLYAYEFSRMQRAMLGLELKDSAPFLKNERKVDTARSYMQSVAGKNFADDKALATAFSAHVKKYQQSVPGLPNDGIIGPETFNSAKAANAANTQKKKTLAAGPIRDQPSHSA